MEAKKKDSKDLMRHLFEARRKKGQYEVKLNERLSILRIKCEVILRQEERHL
jgi:hypothetical protein